MKNLTNILVVLGCLNSFGSYSQPSLMKAMYPRFDVQLAQELIEKGSDVNEHTVRCLPLTYAVINKNKEMVNLLLKNGAKSDTCTAKTLISHLGLYQEFGTILEINGTRVIYTPFYYAIKLNQLDMVKIFFDHGYDVNMKMGGVPFTYPIIIAAGLGNDEMFNYILGKGSDINIKNSDGQTALMFSVLANNVERTRFIIQNGGDVNETSNIGYNPLMYAIEFRGINTEMIDLLLNSGTDLSYVNGKNQSAMSLACLHNKRDLAIKLFEGGAKPTDSQSEVEANARTNHFLADYYLSNGKMDTAKRFYLNSKAFYKESITVMEEEIKSVNKYKALNLLGSALIILSGNIAAGADAKQTSANLGLTQSQTKMVYSGYAENYSRMNSWLTEKEPTIFYEYELPVDASLDEAKIFYKNKIEQFNLNISLIEGILACIEKGLTNQELDSCIKSLQIH